MSAADERVVEQVGQRSRVAMSQLVVRGEWQPGEWWIVVGTDDHAAIIRAFERRVVEGDAPMPSAPVESGHVRMWDCPVVCDPQLSVGTVHLRREIEA